MLFPFRKFYSYILTQNPYIKQYSFGVMNTKGRELLVNINEFMIIYAYNYSGDISG